MASFGQALAENGSTKFRRKKRRPFDYVQGDKVTEMADTIDGYKKPYEVEQMRFDV